MKVEEIESKSILDSRNSSFYINKSYISKQKSHGSDEKSNSKSESSSSICQICKILGHTGYRRRWRYTATSESTSKNVTNTGSTIDFSFTSITTSVTL